MDGIDPVQDGNTGCLARCGFLDAANECVPFFWSVGMASAIQDAAHLEVDKHFLQFGSIQAVRLLQMIGFSYTHHVQRELGHFAHFVFQGHCPHYTVHKSRSGIFGGRGGRGLAARQ